MTLCHKNRLVTIDNRQLKKHCYTKNGPVTTDNRQQKQHYYMERSQSKEKPSHMKWAFSNQNYSQQAGKHTSHAVPQYLLPHLIVLIWDTLFPIKAN